MNIIRINNKIKHFFTIFNAKTYKTFTLIMKYMLFLDKPNITDIAFQSGKTISEINYFFNWAKWNFKLLNKFRITWIRNKFSWCSDKKSDILILDSTIISKNIWSIFWWKLRFFFSNSSKKVVKGFDFFWASIKTISWVKYMLDIKMFVKNPKKKGKNQDKKLWFRFLNECVQKSKAWLIILDSGFKSVNYVKYIHAKLKKHLLVRIEANQYIIDWNWNEKQISKLLKDKNCIRFRKWKMWIIPDIFLRTWYRWWFKNKVNIAVFRYNWAKKASIVVTTANLREVYDNMYKNQWDLSCEDLQNQTNKWINLQSEILKIYAVFLWLYKQRWSIESCFKELKSYIWLENFRFKSYDSIMKYIHICMLAHTLTNKMLDIAFSSEQLFDFIYWFLKKFRNIKNICTITKQKYITLESMKLFLQMVFSCSENFYIKSWLWLIKKSFSVKSISSFKLDN
jgi:hypothetical protein